MKNTLKIFVFSGIGFLALAFVFWFFILGTTVLIDFVYVCRTPKGSLPLMIISDDLISYLYPVCFFIVALLLVCQRWTTNKIWVYPAAYGVFLCCWLPTVNWVKTFGADLLILILPLPLSFAGAYVGQLYKQCRQGGSGGT